MHVRKETSFRRIMKHKHIYVLLLPTMLFYILFRYAPMFGNIIAFQDYSVTKGILGSNFVGLKHFADFLNNYKFWQLVKNTLAINVYGLVFGFPAPIILALLLNEVKCTPFKKTVQTITYMPHFISTVVAASMILTFVSADGFINGIIKLFGGEAVSFMSEAKYFYRIFITSEIWQNIGWSSIIYIAALSSVDQEQYEAAAIDGAGRWQRMIHITLPGIMSTIITMLILRIGQLLTVGYEKIILLYNPAIYETADVISTYVYRRGILEGGYSYSAAVGIFNSVFNFIFLLTSNFVAKKVSGSGLF